TWEEKSMSFFTYWLNEGLKGYADSDQDGWVGTDELFDYIHRNLERTQKIWPHHQKPVMVTTRSTAHFRVIRPRPRDLQGVLDDFADQIVTQMELLNRHSLYVHPWSPPADVSASFSDLNHWKSTLDYCQRELQRLIDAKTAGKGFSRVNRPTVASAVHLKSQLSPAEKDSQGREIYFLSTLLEVPGAAENPDKIQMRVYKRHTDETYEPPYLPVGEAPALASSSDKRRVQIEVKTPDGRFIPRPFQQIHGVTYVALNAGEVYRVVVQDPDIDREPVGLRLLVDGQNTLPQYLPYVEEKYGIVEAAPEESPEAESDGAGKRDLSATSLEEVSYRPHVRLDHARYWIMQKPVPYYFHGFYRQAGLESRYGEFTVSPTIRTESSHQGFPREMGLITVAFYHLQRTRGAEQDVMTVPGKENPHSLFVVEGYELGTLRECLQIRYASSASLQAAIKE
ncbi:MAG: hypothetical protein Q4E67_02130, partial [Planctomycetia bacterium]|nr:hypothetical protein [Planctomycetia bacterium]